MAVGQLRGNYRALHSRFFEKVQLRVWRALWYAFQVLQTWDLRAGPLLR